MNKKILVISAVSVLVILVVGLFGYNYWKKGTPGYSFQQLRSAYNSHDTEQFKKYFDQDQIFDNYYGRTIPKAVSQIVNSSASELSKKIQEADVKNSTRSIVGDSFKKGVYDLVIGKDVKDETNSEFKGFLNILIKSDLLFKVNGKNATAEILLNDYTYGNQKNYPVYNLKVLFKQQDDRSWKITDIQGYEDYSFSFIDDATRVSDLYKIGTLVDKYINAGEKPFLTNDNWRVVLKDYSIKTGGDSVLPEDPTVSYSDQNKYVFSIINSDSVKTYSYIIRAKLGSVNNENIKGKYLDSFNKISKNNMSNLLGVDCTAPAYCWGSFGKESEWYKLFTK